MGGGGGGLQNSTQTLKILWPVYPIHKLSMSGDLFEELSFCHFSPLNTSILALLRVSNLVNLSFEYLSFLNKWKTTILFPSPLTFLQWGIASHEFKFNVSSIHMPTFS